VSILLVPSFKEFIAADIFKDHCIALLK